MTSINDSLSPDLLFNIFKHLDCFETTRIRRVCKQWFPIIDEHKSFWRILHLPEKSLKKWDPSILELFDRKSDSTLQDVEVGTEVNDVFLKDLFNILQRSKETLRHLLLKSDSVYYDNPVDFLSVYIKMICLKFLTPRRTYKVRLQRKSVKSDSEEVGPNAASPLKVLWYGSGRSILAINSSKFENLVSLDSGAFLTASEWREFLEGPSRSLKHLKISFKKGRIEDHSGISSLYFPVLEVIELSDGGRFPQWLLIPDSSKLVALSDVSNLPSISELWSWSSSSHEDEIVNRLPKLRTLCLLSPHLDMDDVLEILKERRDNVEAGFQVDGVKMETIKTLILPYNFSNPDLSDELREGFRRCRELVEVVEEEAQFRFIEVEY